MRIKEVYARSIKDSLKQDTIEIFIRTDNGRFTASAPGGVSRGSFETSSFIADTRNTVHLFNENSKKITEMEINEISDLRIVEAIIDKRKFGGNTLFALEAGILKALAFEKRKEVWQLLKPEGRKMPAPVGNIVGGGKHSKNKKKPDFQEFLVIPHCLRFNTAVETMKEMHKRVGHILKLKERNFLMKKDAENAWQTALNDREALSVINSVRNILEHGRRINIDIGVDIAASHAKRNKKQIEKIAKLDEEFGLFYIEDPLNECDFSEWSELSKKLKGKNCLIVGDDLTATNPARLEKAIKMKACNAVIVKPNQNGSLLETIKFFNIAKKNKFFTIVSHRAGETMDDFIADFAFGMQADFVKFGVLGRERDIKLKRLEEIERRGRQD
ncbi:MAG: enolase C-terminal domain-like protein [Nanoarchaeota archaeon]